MQNAKELFLHELSDMLDAENRILEALSEQGDESSNSSLQSAFRSHYKQTEGQIERLEQCFEVIDEEVEQTECAGIKGLLEEHESMVEEDPSPDILDVFNIAAAIKVERYEISSYEFLIRLAENIEQAKIVKLLKQNLKEEEQALKKLSTLATEIEPENMGSDESDEERESAENEAREMAEEENAHSRPHIVKKSGPRKGRAA